MFSKKSNDILKSIGKNTFKSHLNRFLKKVDLEYRKKISKSINGMNNIDNSGSSNFLADSRLWKKKYVLVYMY